jgi:hypothetical protein
MRVHLYSKGHLFTPALKEVRWTRAKRLLQWHAKNGHENILFTDKKIFTIWEQYNNQYNMTYAQTSLEVRFRVQDAITLPTSWFGGGYPIRG